MDNEKLTGSFYTPEYLVQFMVDYLESNQHDFSCVLEPAAGDGRFLRALQQTAGLLKLDRNIQIRPVSQPLIIQRVVEAEQGSMLFVLHQAQVPGEAIGYIFRIPKTYLYG